MKFTGTFSKDLVRTKVIEFEEISRAKAKKKMRDILKDNLEEGISAGLFELHRSDVDLICKWDIDSNLVIKESLTI
tara:strand:+ start:1016 stop:1243 length:228 start_codon:yes stop_codon:yes gene_type:complete